MVKVKRTWREKMLAKEEGENSRSGNDEEEGGQEKDKELAEGETRGPVDTLATEVNLVFVIPEEFCAPEKELVALALGAEKSVFEKPVEVGKHMRPLFIKGHIDGKPLGRMMVDGGESVNIMTLHI
jgi:hypothetical protein